MRNQIDHTGLYSKIDSGMLDRPITFYSPSIARSVTGHADITFVSAGTDFAYRVDGVPSEDEKNYQETSSAYVTFTVRYRSDVKPSWQIDDNGIRYDVEGVQEVGRRLYLNIRTLYTEPRS